MRPHECRSGVLSCDLSDHLPIFFLLPSFATNKHVNNERVYFRRKITNEALGIFLRSIESADWNPVYLQYDAENAYDVFEGILKDCHYAAFPLEKCTSKQTKKFCKPWMSSILYARIKTKNKLYHEYLKKSDGELFTKYKNTEIC